MNIVEFFSLPQKEINKIVKSKGFKYHKYLDCNTFDEFCNKLDIEKSDEYKVTYWNSINRGSEYTEVYIDMEYKGMPFPFKIYINKPCKLEWSIDDSDIYRIYKKVSTFYDSRPDFSNLEFELFRYHSCLLEGRNFKTYLDELKLKYDELISICNELGELYDNGTIEKIANVFLKVPFDRGNVNSLYVGPMAPFKWMVCAVYNIGKQFGEDALTKEEILKLWNYYYEAKEQNNESLDKIFSIETIFTGEKVCLTLDELKHYISTVDTNSGKPSFAELLYKANKEYYEKRKSVEKEIADKYKIDETYLFSFSKEPKITDFLHIPVPSEFADKYR